MTIQAIVFDIGGVLEITPDMGITTKWEQRLNADIQACIQANAQ